MCLEGELGPPSRGASLVRVRCLWEGVDVGERKKSLAHQALPFVLILSRMKQDCHRSPICAGATTLVEHSNNLTPRSTIRYGLPLWCIGIHTSLPVQTWVPCMPDDVFACLYFDPSRRRQTQSWIQGDSDASWGSWGPMVELTSKITEQPEHYFGTVDTLLYSIEFEISHR